MSARIVMSDDVAAELGDEAAGHAARFDVTGHPCVVCGAVFTRFDTAAHVVVARGTSSTHVRYAHPGCGPSLVVDVPDEALHPVPEGGADMALTAGWGGPDAALPILVAETAARMFVHADPAGDLVDVVAAGLLGMGFTLISTPDEVPPPVPEWIAVIRPAAEPGGSAALMILDQDGTLFYDGTLIADATWTAEALRRHACVLYVGDVGLSGAPADPEARQAAMTAALHEGRLVAGTVPIGTPADYGIGTD